jgi:hypothetical protein
MFSTPFTLHASRPGRGDGHWLAEHCGGGAAVGHLLGDALAQLDGLKISALGAPVAFGPTAPIGVVIKHARHRLLGQDAQVFDAGDDGHDRRFVSQWEGAPLHTPPPDEFRFGAGNFLQVSPSLRRALRRLARHRFVVVALVRRRAVMPTLSGLMAGSNSASPVCRWARQRAVSSSSGQAVGGRLRRVFGMAPR